MKLLIIGSGNVAWHLAKAFRKSDLNLVGISARNKTEGKKIAKANKCDYYHADDQIPEIDMAIICVSDDAIPSVAAGLPENIKATKLVVHTSGSASLNALGSCNRAGVLYPLQTFSKGTKLRYRDIPFCIHGNSADTIAKIYALAAQVSTSVYTIDDQQREQIHLSAVMINNFVNHIIHRSESLLSQHGIPVEILQPLLKETITKQNTIGSHDAQTGPARRDDKKTIKKHLKQLKKKSDKAIYKAISESIKSTYKK